MKQAIKRTTILALVALMLLSLVACGGGGSDKSSGSYKTDEVKAKLASVFGIEASDISVSDRGATVVMS